jgi:hypothetical protein
MLRNHNGALTEAAGDAHDLPNIGNRQQMRLMPASQSALRGHCREAAETFAQAALHAMVPAHWHAAGQRVPRSDQHTRHRTASSDPQDNTAYPVLSVVIRAPQARRDRLRARRAPR